MLTVFFPKKENLNDDRADAIRATHKNTLFIPSGEFLMAHEILTLTTYSYDHYLSKKDEKSYTILVPSNIKKQIQEKTPLLNAIIRARDIINQPPTDTRPEAFVEYISSYKWKNFTLKVLDAKELKKL